jgi:hypothetical protein
VNGKGDEYEEGMQTLERRLKQKGKNELILQDEEEDLENGLGMVGTVSQPRRPV